MTQKHFNIDIELLFASPGRMKVEMKNEAFSERDRFTDSIEFCPKDKTTIYHKILNDLIRPAFLQEYIQQKNLILS